MSLIGGKGALRMAAAGAGVLLLLPFAVFFLGGGDSLMGETAQYQAVRGDSDVYDGAWHFWWVGTAMESGVDPRFCPLTRHPHGASLTRHNVGWPDTWLMGITGVGSASPATAYNLALLFGSLLTALGAWWTARLWGTGQWGAIFAAMAVVWLPARIAHMGQHYQVASLGYLVFYLGFLRSWLTGRRRLHLAVSGLFLLAAMLESGYFVLLAAAGTAITILLTRREIAASVSRSLAPLVVFVGVSVLACVFYGTAPGPEVRLVDPPWREAIFWAAEPQSWLLPSPWGLAGTVSGLPARLSWMANQFEGVVTPGLTLLVLFTASVVRGRKWLLGVLVLSVAVLALGPELRLLGKPLGIPLPYRLIQLVPVLSGARAPSRFALVAGVFIAIEAGRFFGEMKGRWKLLAGAVFLAEMLVPVLGTVPADIPEQYSSFREPGGPVLEIPASPEVRRYAFFQTLDGQPRFLTFMARAPEEGIPAPLEPFSTESDKVPDEEDAIATGASVILFNRWLFSRDELETLDARFRKLFPAADTGDRLWVWKRRDE